MSDSPDWLDIFQEPPDFFERKREFAFESFRLASGEEVSLRLVGHSPLWGHFLWNAGRDISRYLEQRVESLVKDRLVLELGAGSGLPSLVCAIHGASRVVVTDYPDADLIENLRYNVAACELLPDCNVIQAEGYLWGTPVDQLARHLPPESRNDGFDTLILADLLFNHSEHGKLVLTVTSALKKCPDAVALVFFTPYRPWLLQKDLAFFELAEARGLIVTKMYEQVLDEVMFPNDPGDERLRRTVYGYEIRWRDAIDG